jgi:hypothetical protein
MEDLEAHRAADQVKYDYRESLRLVRIRQCEEVAALQAKLKSERELLLIRRETDRQVLVNVKRKLDTNQYTFRESSKAWGLTRVARMNSISKTIPPDEPLRPVVPTTPRAAIRARGRFEPQAGPVQLPALNFAKF